MAFISLSMTLSGTIYANSYNSFDPAFDASLYETHMRKQIGGEILDQIPDPSAAPISLSSGCSSLSPPANISSVPKSHREHNARGKISGRGREVACWFPGKLKSYSII